MNTMERDSEKEIFQDLTQLCALTGFAHAIAYYCINSIVLFSEETGIISSAENHNNRLIRTEISTLIGLMVKQPINLSLPTPETLQLYIGKTQELLKRLQGILRAPMKHTSRASENVPEPFTMGNFLREGIFYSGESAYSFQYLEFSVKRYINDNSWFISKKGFSIQDAEVVIRSIIKFQNRSLIRFLSEGEKSDISTGLNSFIFKAHDIADESGLDINIVTKILSAFTIPKDSKNKGFMGFSDFNETNAYPIIYLKKYTYLLFQNYSLLEAFYETPFYWFLEDDLYQDIGMKNRGDFLEDIAAQKLASVFGKNNVFKNVHIRDLKNREVGEVDVLVFYGNRAIVLQGKSKKLTIASRKGNDSQINDDFEKAIKVSYKQGLDCAKFLNENHYKYYHDDKEINIPDKFREIYIFCVVSDHYPSLSFQVQQFLVFEETQKIKPPFVIDLFLLDILTELLKSPLYFLSYINRRTKYMCKITAPHELVVLAYHLKCNLWFENPPDIISFEDDECWEIYEALLSRREGFQGKSTPQGILTLFKGTPFAILVDQLKNLDSIDGISLGFVLLNWASERISIFNIDIEKLIMAAKRNNKRQYLSILFEGENIGLTIHIHNGPTFFSGEALKKYCEKIKYLKKIHYWFGLILDLHSLRIETALCLDYEWQYSEDMEKYVKPLKKRLPKNSTRKIRPKRKIGRNCHRP